MLDGYDEKKVDEALKLIKVKYQVEEAVLDFRTAKDNPILVHPEDNWKPLVDVGGDNQGGCGAGGGFGLCARFFVAADVEKSQA